jgi:4-amino-4-deoxy-L-arabinose transferase-like glycosyltransferase
MERTQMPENKAPGVKEKWIAGILIFAAFLVLKFPTLALPFYWDEMAHVIPLSVHVMERDFNPILYVPVGDNSRENLYGLVQDPGHPPLVFLTIALAFKIFGTRPIAAHGVSMIFSWMALFFTYLIARRLYGRGQAVSSALILLLSPLFFAISGTTHLTVATTGLTAASIYFAVTKRSVPFAVACSLMMLTRGNAFVAYPGLFVYIFCVLWDGKAPSTLRKSLPYLIPAFVWAAWMIFHYAATGYLFVQPQNFFNVLPHHHLDTFLWGVARVAYIFFFLRGGYFLSLSVLVFLAFYIRRNLPARGRGAGLRSFLIKTVSAHTEVLLFALIPLGYMGAFSFLQNLSAQYLLPTNPLLVIMGIASLFYMFQRRKLVAFLLVALLAAYNVYCWRGDDPLLAAVIALKPDVPNKNRPSDYSSYENNMDYVDVIKLHREAARYLEENFADRRILASWPPIMELSYPYLGYVKKPLNMVFMGFFIKDMNPDDFDVLLYATESDYQPNYDAIFRKFKLDLVKRFQKGSKGVFIFTKAAS